MNWLQRLFQAIFGRRPAEPRVPAPDQTPPGPRPVPPPPPPPAAQPVPVPPPPPAPSPPVVVPVPPPAQPDAYLAGLGRGNRAPVSVADYRALADRLGAEVEAVMAVAEVESGPYGAFGWEQRPVVLFEAHKFAEHTGQRYNESHPQLSSRRWNRALYPRGPRSEMQRLIYEQLAQAYALDGEAALKATSWGRFQILGEHYQWQGFATAHAFVADLAAGEVQQLAAFERFVVRNGLMGALRSKNWRVFARGYNGPRYEENNYHVKMAEAYDRLKRNGVAGV